MLCSARSTIRSPIRLREGLYRYNERVGTLLDGGIFNARPISSGVRTSSSCGLDAQGARRHLDLCPLRREHRIAHVEEAGEPCEVWHELVERFDPFRL